MSDEPQKIRFEWIDLHYVATLASACVSLMIGYISFDAISNYVGTEYGWHVFEQLAALIWSASVGVSCFAWWAIRILGEYVR